MDGFQTAATPEIGAFLSLTEVTSCDCSQAASPARLSENLQTYSNGVREIRQNSSFILETYSVGLTRQSGEILLPHPPAAAIAARGMTQTTEKRSSAPTGTASDTSRLLAPCGSLTISLAEAVRLANAQPLIVATSNTVIGGDESHSSLSTTLWLPNQGPRLDYQICIDGGLHLNQGFGISRR